MIFNVGKCFLCIERRLRESGASPQVIELQDKGQNLLICIIGLLFP